MIIHELCKEKHMLDCGTWVGQGQAAQAGQVPAKDPITLLFCLYVAHLLSLYLMDRTGQTDPQ